MYISWNIYLFWSCNTWVSSTMCCVAFTFSGLTLSQSELTQTRLHVSPSSLLILTTVDCFFFWCVDQTLWLCKTMLTTVSDRSEGVFFCWCVKGGQNGLTQDFIRNNTNKFKFIQTLKAVDPHCSVIYCFQQRVRNLYVVSVGTADGLIVFLYFAREKK